MVCPLHSSANGRDCSACAKRTRLPSLLIARLIAGSYSFSADSLSALTHLHDATCTVAQLVVEVKAKSMLLASVPEQICYKHASRCMRHGFFYERHCRGMQA